VSVGLRSVPEATSPTMRSSPRTPLPVASAIVRGPNRPLPSAAFRRWWVHACPSHSRSRPDWSGSGYQPESAACSLASSPRPLSASGESPRRKVPTHRSRQSRIRQARVARGKSAGLLRRAHCLENSPQPATLGFTFGPVPFSLKLARGVQVQASRDGLRTNHGPRVRRVYVGQQFANPAIPATPMTFYAPSRPRLQQPSYLAPQLPPTADKAQQAQALASAIQRIRTLHHQDFPAVQKLVVPYPPRPDHAVILRRRMNDALERLSIFRRWHVRRRRPPPCWQHRWNATS
jgi:hypothetical protein